MTLKERQLQVEKSDIDKFTKELQSEIQEIKELKAKLKGNLELTEARQGVWDKIL